MFAAAMSKPKTCSRLRKRGTQKQRKSCHVVPNRKRTFRTHVSRRAGAMPYHLSALSAGVLFDESHAALVRREKPLENAPLHGPITKSPRTPALLRAQHTDPSQELSWPRRKISPSAYVPSGVLHMRCSRASLPQAAMSANRIPPSPPTFPLVRGVVTSSSCQRMWEIS